MRLILASMKYSYGDPQRGISSDHFNYHDVLAKMPLTLEHFDFVEITRTRGQQEMNRMFLDLVNRFQPDAVLALPFHDEFLAETLDEVRRKTTTIVYFFDDMWRVEYSRRWAKHYSFSVTSDILGKQRFKFDSIDNVIYSPFACNTHVFKKKDLAPEYDVSFVGQFHPYRQWVIKQLTRAGIKTNVWGYGWKNGTIPLDQMVDVFNRSRISLNLSNCESFDARYLMSSIRAMKQGVSTLVRRDTKVREQIKARHFEIPACGALQMSYYVEGLERCFVLGEEIALYSTIDELVEKIRYYLRFPEEASKIAAAGYQRTIRDHTMERRLMEIFTNAGVKVS